MMIASVKESASGIGAVSYKSGENDAAVGAAAGNGSEIIGRGITTEIATGTQGIGGTSEIETHETGVTHGTVIATSAHVIVSTTVGCVVITMIAEIRTAVGNKVAIYYKVETHGIGSGGSAAAAVTDSTGAEAEVGTSEITGTMTVCAMHTCVRPGAAVLTESGRGIHGIVTQMTGGPVVPAVAVAVGTVGIATPVAAAVVYCPAVDPLAVVLAKVARRGWALVSRWHRR